MIESFFLGVVQGIAEWLPVSSEGLIVLLRLHVFGETSLYNAVSFALWLHLGTFLAALVYFRHDVWRLLLTLRNYKTAPADDKWLLRFLIISTVTSGILGGAFLYGIRSYETIETLPIDWVTIVIGLALLFTGALQQLQKTDGKQLVDVRDCDAGWLGVAQGMAAVPGLSRSGLTTAALLWRGFSAAAALKLSFLMSLPIVLAGNIVLNAPAFVLSVDHLVGLVTAFVFGLGSIALLLRIARQVNFSYFVIAFGLLMIASGFFL